jgi:hypothetical protein
LGKIGKNRNADSQDFHDGTDFVRFLEKGTLIVMIFMVGNDFKYVDAK